MHEANNAGDRRSADAGPGNPSDMRLRSAPAREFCHADVALGNV